MENSSLKNKTVLFLGSSVTYGYASDGISFADYLAEKTGCVAVKEAVSGTTLAGMESSTYVSRLLKTDLPEVDMLVCQLSTNDASQNLELGTVSEEFSDVDRNSVAGAIETILAYAKKTWNCPVYFYTSSRYESEQYGAMVKLLYELQEKWGFEIIDLWNNKELNNITEEQRKRYMADAIHPTQAGYLEWWLPEFEKALEGK